MVDLLDGDISSAWYDEMRMSRYLGVDIETSGLDYDKDKIACVQVYVPNSGVVMVRNLKEPDRLMDVLKSGKCIKIFHHAMFDLTFLIRDYGIFPTKIGCTKVCAKILDPKKKMYSSHSLKHLLFTELEVVLDKTLSVSDWFAKTLSPEQIEYAASDVKYLPALYAILEGKLAEQDLLQQARNAQDFLPSAVFMRLKNEIEDVYGY